MLIPPSNGSCLSSSIDVVELVVFRTGGGVLRAIVPLGRASWVMDADEGPYGGSPAIPSSEVGLVGHRDSSLPRGIRRKSLDTQ